MDPTLLHVPDRILSGGPACNGHISPSQRVQIFIIYLARGNCFRIFIGTLAINLFPSPIYRFVAWLRGV